MSPCFGGQVQEVRENTHIMEDQLTNILQAALALVSVNDNRDMRKISAAVLYLIFRTNTLALTTQKSLQSATEAETCND